MKGSCLGGLGSGPRWAGEPFGTLVLALAVTVIEVALIVSIRQNETRPS